ncbi:acyl-CoA synthetase [Nocardia sp. A7]|uniref:acyl-CoA synthetase n=1 Tax=Nocardia sp. A7 TaxID=2789274 RepID=UPI00397A5125
MTPPLLTSLYRDDRTDRPIVNVGEQSMHKEDLLLAGAAVADRIAGAEVVAIDATAGIDTVIAVVGCLLVGATAVPVPSDSGLAERRHILSDSRAELWIGPRHDDLSIPILTVDSLARSSTTYPEPDPNAPALIIYTSGTTGSPKGVVVSRRAIAACLDSVADAWQWSAEDTLVQGLPLFHIHGLILGVLGALRIGSPLVHTVRPDPKRYAAAAGTLYFAVPTVWSRVCTDPASARELARARLLVSGSAPLPTQVFEGLRELTGMAPIERYGMTETLITVSTRYRGERRPGWVGLPIDGVRSRLRTETGELAAHDGKTLGQLEISAPTLFDGYLNQPDKTAEVTTTDGWFSTGDIAVIDADGFHRIVGRESVDMIKSGGYRIGAGEVEEALIAHPSVREAAVIGVHDADLGQRIVAYVVGDSVDQPALIDFVATNLSVHKRPREIRVVDHLPKNAMGKIQKKTLAKQHNT